MSRGFHTSTWRPLTVWAAVSVAATASAASVPAAFRLVGAHGSFADLLVAVCAGVLAASLAWLWVVTTVTVTGLVAGRGPHWQVGVTRRLVLVACGAAVVAGPGLPAHAAGGEGPELLVGLALPDRATAPTTPTRHRRAPAPAPVVTSPSSYVVRAGDSLWSIARAHPEPGTSVDERWRAIWRANHDVVGDDPDLILPGQALRLPARPGTTTDGPTERER